MAVTLYVAVSVLLLASVVAVSRMRVAARRWSLVAALGVIGLALLVPVTCETLTMPICDNTFDCNLDTSATCGTLVGLSVPYAQAVGAGWARALGVVLVVVLVGGGVLWGRLGGGSGARSS